MEEKSQEIISLRACMVKDQHKEENFNFFLSKSTTVQKFRPKENIDLESEIWVKTPDEKRPVWASFIDKLNGEPIEDLKSLSSSAVVFVRVPGEGIVIFLFGYGRYLINQAYIQGDFGIKTALNCLDHKTLRSIDSVSLDDQAVQKRTQASRFSNIAAFGIDVSKDILRAVTGVPKDGVVYNSITGGDAFIGFSKKLDPEDLLETAQELIIYYNQEDYKENFEWIDNIKRIKKDEVIENLNDLLLQRLKSKDTENVSLNIPEIISWDKVDGFSFTRDKDKVFPNLDIEKYYDSFESSEYNEERLKNDRIFIFDSNNQSERYALYRCLYTEIKKDDKIYVYFNSEWYEIDKDFVSNINKEISVINTCKLEFPKVLREQADGKGKSKYIMESEEKYNARAATELGCINLDRKLIKTKMASSSIEICDLFTNEKQFIHVKHRKGGSAGLSHLFSQGYVSAETLLSDKGFRKSARKKLSKARANLDLIPLNSYKGQDYEVIYLVLGVENDIRESLPFFSKVNLYRTHKELSQRGYKVSLASVPFSEIKNNV